MPRLFAAIRPPASVRDTLPGLMSGVPGVRWQSDEQIHLTLRFMGEVDRHVAEDLAAALESIRFAPFELRVAGVGSFARRREGTLWAGVERSEPLLHLQKKIERATTAAGLPPEGRAFHPHLTLARFRGGAGQLEGFKRAHAGFALPPFTVDAFGLFESRLGSGGASYTIVSRYLAVPERSQVEGANTPQAIRAPLSPDGSVR